MQATRAQGTHVGASSTRPEMSPARVTKPLERNGPSHTYFDLLPYQLSNDTVPVRC